MKINISRTFARFSLFLIKPFSLLSDCKETRTQNHLVHKQTLNHLAKLATIECGFTLKCIRDMTRTYSHSLSLCVFTTTMSELWNLWQWHANEWYLETLIGQLNVSFQWSNMKLFKDLRLGFNGSDSSFSSLSSLIVSDLEMANVSGLVFFSLTGLAIDFVLICSWKVNEPTEILGLAASLWVCFFFTWFLFRPALDGFVTAGT